MFERFTADAREAVVRAQTHARVANDPQITGRHLLLALLDPDSPIAGDLTDLGVSAASLRKGGPKGRFTESDSDALLSLGVDLEAVRRAVEDTFGPGALDRPVPRARRWWRRRDERAAVAWHVPFSTAAKKSLKCALLEGIRLGRRDLGPEHLVLGVLGADDPDLRLPGQVVSGVRAHFERRLRSSA